MPRDRQTHGIEMKDLTRNSITRHIVVLAAPLVVSMITQIGYQLVDLYFVARISVQAAAGVNAAASAILAIAALTQVLGVGTTALVAQAAGRGRPTQANRVFNQALLLALLVGFLATVLLYSLAGLYLRSIAADRATIAAGAEFLNWVAPGYALFFPWIAISSALRGTGVVRPTVVIYMFTVVVNALLAPVLIAGVGSGNPLGVKGAGLATTVSIALGTLVLLFYAQRRQKYLSISSACMKPRLQIWGQIFNIGLPVGVELALTFVSSAVIYYAIRNFGPAAQAGFGIGSRVQQTILLPGMAIAFAAGPVAGQNFGANKTDRVKETFRTAALMTTAAMLATTVLVQWNPTSVLAVFDVDDSTSSVAVTFLEVMSWAFVAQGLVYTCSTMLQSIGNTIPSLVSAGIRFLVFTIPTLWMSVRPAFRLEHVLYLSTLATLIQATLSLWLLHQEFKRRLA